MLAHVTFHNSNSTSAIEWVNYNSVLATLEEMETGYTAFQRIDVTVDSNPTNAFVRPLRRWAIERQLRRVRLRVSLHARLPHPFRLAWVHREHMERAVLSGRYDWFLYTEADVFVPSLAMRVQVQLALKLYALNTDIDLDSFDLLRPLGKGAMGMVEAVRKRDTGRVYAMKKIKKEVALAKKAVTAASSAAACCTMAPTAGRWSTQR